MSEFLRLLDLHGCKIVTGALLPPGASLQMHLSTLATLLEDIPPKTRAMETSKVVCRKVIANREKKKGRLKLRQLLRPRVMMMLILLLYRTRQTSRGPLLALVKGNEEPVVGGEKGNGDNDPNIVVVGHGDTADGLFRLHTQPSPRNRSGSRIEFAKKPMRDKVHLDAEETQQQANTLFRYEALTEEHADLVHAHKSCKDVKVHYKECKKELAKERLKELEEEKKEADQLSTEQTDRIKQLEEALKQFEDDAHKLRLDRERYIVECGEIFSLVVGKGFIDGLSVGRKEEDIQAILKDIPIVDPTSSETFMEEYKKLFDKRYPYVDKVARAYLLNPTGLQNVMPDGTGPTPG
ncbi:hypothetical protein Tco_1413377 [Tanacetum coccineum]